MSQPITTKTLIPISLACSIGIGIFYFSSSYATIEDNKRDIKKNEVAILENSKDTNRNYIEIIQRLTRIEEAIKK